MDPCLSASADALFAPTINVLTQRPQALTFSEPGTPAAAVLPGASAYEGVTASNYRSLRGTDGADSFDGSTYANTGFFNNSLLVHFFGGGGNDEMGGSTRNDNLWGGTGNDTEYGFTGDGKVYGEEGDDVLLGQDGNDLLDGGVDNDALVEGNGDDMAWGCDGADTLTDIEKLSFKDALVSNDLHWRMVA
ncbi:hypothetical protein B9Z51_16900 [Limnohabitans sp. T6-5]|uniref:calcium-binding protein n=1 Tax=Limnohabitans sp. T6-5 TaxID=1100724 RepID=UPI000D360660|nr:calcium-binding protein [Limnohabitans sp. T6-5]PUE06473.1 hypothetical protein B9Z51_16900 [Limnohabitans sp. T6-5]